MTCPWLGQSPLPHIRRTCLSNWLTVLFRFNQCLISKETRWIRKSFVVVYKCLNVYLLCSNLRTHPQIFGDYLVSLLQNPWNSHRYPAFLWIEIHCRLISNSSSPITLIGWPQKHVHSYRVGKKNCVYEWTGQLLVCISKACNQICHTHSQVLSREMFLFSSFFGSRSLYCWMQGIRSLF